MSQTKQKCPLPGWKEGYRCEQFGRESVRVEGSGALKAEKMLAKKLTLSPE